MTDRNDEYRPGNPASNPADRSGRGQAKGPGSQQPHASGEWGARDYNRGYEETSQGDATSRGRAQGRDYEERFGARGQGEWGQDRSGQSQYGSPRQDTHSGYRNPEANAGRYQQGSHEYGSYAGRQAGEGYGRSSGYGNPDQDRYGADSGYRGTSFVSPADTQLSHSGLGRQSYSGMGPKNYTRSDERINEDLCERLTQDHDVDASELEVKIANGTATLEGTVPQRWMKHRAEDLADSCAGVRNVENRIKVQAAGSYSGPSTQHDVSGGADPLGGKTRGSSGTAH